MKLAPPLSRRRTRSWQLVSRSYRSRPLGVESLEDRSLLAAGSLDTSFGDDGKVTTDFLGPNFDVGRGLVAIQADGKIVVVGHTSGGGLDFALARYNTNGSLDTSFDNDGKVTTDFAGRSDRAFGVAIQADGKIVAAGHSVQSGLGNDDFALARYNTNGSLDTSFDTDGKVTTSFASGTDQALSVAIQADGKIVAAGHSNQGATFRDFALARYNTNGSLDTSFDTDGKVTTDFTSLSDIANGVAIQADGKIVAAGDSFISGNVFDFSLARYNTDGSLDTSFDTDGKVNTDFGTRQEHAHSVAIQADGKIVAAGVSIQFGPINFDFALARYNTNGSLDTTFGTGGKVTTDFAGISEFVGGVAIQADGKIVVAGDSFQIGTGNDFLLARYNTNGSLDTTFDNDGTATTDFLGPNFDLGRDLVAIQADGKIVAAGTSNDASGSDFAVIRYNTNGSLDTTFGTGGKVTTDFASRTDQANGVAIQADGKIVAAGNSFQSSTSSDFALVRYNTNGSLDTTFGTGGKVTTDFASSSDQANGVAIQADGKIVVVGASLQSGDFALARYNTNGSLDTSFDTDGKVTTDFAGRSDQAFGVAIQADGKIVAAGHSSQIGTFNDFALARYNTNGSLDTSFDTDGKVTTDFASLHDEATDVVLQADGKIVAAGNSFQSSTSSDFALVRYNTNGSLDTSFDTDGKVTTDFASDSDIANGVAIQADGKIVAAGGARQSGTDDDFALVRYNTNGGLDTRFDTDGKVTTDFASDSDIANGVAIQADGKIVAAGHSFQSSTSFDFALVRYIAVGPQGQIEDIIDNVQALVPDPLNNGQGNSLLVKLQGAVQQLDSDKVTPAINKLEAFVNEVTAFIDGEILTSEEGHPLIDAANVNIDQLSGSSLHLAGETIWAAAGLEGLTEEQLQPVVEQAISYWSAAGVQTVPLRTTDIRIADIPGLRLGVVGSSGTIWIDRDAAGYGWAINTSSTTLVGRVDLLATVTHELGHVLGFDHTTMGDTLAVGTGRIPQPLPQAGDADDNGDVDIDVLSAFDDKIAWFENKPPQAGDANLDIRFDEQDIVQVLQAGKYLTGEPATFEEGDWNGDGIFDQLDIVAALQTGNYLQGPYAADTLFAAIGG